MNMIYKANDLWNRYCAYFLRPLFFRIAGASIGRNVVIRKGCTLYGNPKNLTIKSRTWINENVFFDCTDRIEIGEHVGVAFNVTFNTSYHDVGYPNRCGPTRSKGVKIEDGCWICTSVVVCPGVTIHARSVAASGAVITKDVPSDTLYGGVPARFIKNLNLH